jgi:hypothetical protein
MKPVKNTVKNTGIQSGSLFRRKEWPAGEWFVVKKTAITSHGQLEIYLRDFNCSYTIDDETEWEWK